MSRSERTIVGMQDLRKTLQELLPREVQNLTRRAVVRVAAVIRDDMRKSTKNDDPKLSKAIVSKRERGQPGLVEAGVYVTAGSGKGTAPRRRWHWREFGTTKNVPKPFVTPAYRSMERNIEGLFREEVGRQIEREMAKRAKK